MTNVCQAVVDGRVVGERRAHRIYTHAVVAAQIAAPAPRQLVGTVQPGRWSPQERMLVALSFHHRLDLAQTAASKWIGHEALEPGTVRIVETIVVQR